MCFPCLLRIGKRVNLQLIHFSGSLNVSCGSINIRKLVSINGQVWFSLRNLLDAQPTDVLEFVFHFTGESSFHSFLATRETSLFQRLPFCGWALSNSSVQLRFLDKLVISCGLFGRGNLLACLPTATTLCCGFLCCQGG